MTADSLRGAARLIRLGISADLRSPGLRLAAVVGALGVAVYAWNQGSMVGSAALVLSSWLGRVYGVAACLWFAYAAIRDQNDQNGAVLRSKPVDGTRWVFINWTGGMTVWLILLGGAFLAAALAQLPHAGALGLRAHGFAFLRSAALLVSVATLSFGLSRMLRSPLGGIITVFAWFCAMAGLEFIPGFLRPDYSQNSLLFLAAGAWVLALCALLVERFRRGELRRPLAPLAALVALLALTAAAAAHAIGQTPQAIAAPAGMWAQMSRQYLRLGSRVPGFWLPDGSGGTVRTADYPGKILIIFLFAAEDLDAARTLPAMEVIRKEFGDRGVQPIAVCLSPNHGDGRLLARAGGYAYPIGIDLSTVKASAPPESSIAIAYDAQNLPKLVVTDRRRRARAILFDPFYSVEQLRLAVEARLAEEPE